MIQALQIFGAACSGGDFFGFPKWYKYLSRAADCSPQLSSINDVYLIIGAIIEMLLRIAALLAVGFVIYGGIQYITSQGEPDKTSQARSTIINALIGLAISLTAAAAVTFVAGRIN